MQTYGNVGVTHSVGKRMFSYVNTALDHSGGRRPPAHLRSRIKSAFKAVISSAKFSFHSNVHSLRIYWLTAVLEFGDFEAKSGKLIYACISSYFLGIW